MDALRARRWWALGALTLAVLAVGLDATVLGVALPTLATDLHASTADLQWFVSGYTLVLAAALLPGGLLGDRCGRKKVLPGRLRNTPRAASLLQTALTSAATRARIVGSWTWNDKPCTAVERSTRRFLVARYDVRCASRGRRAGNRLALTDGLTERGCQSRYQVL